MGEARKRTQSKATKKTKKKNRTENKQTKEQKPKKHNPKKIKGLCKLKLFDQNSTRPAGLWIC